MDGLIGLLRLVRLTGLVRLVALLALAARVQAGDAIEYRFSFPDAEHHWMQVEATFADLPDGPVELRFSRSSPGRYSLHDFVKHVDRLTFTTGSDRPIVPDHPNPSEWTVTSHDSTVRVSYRVFGDRLDGTYLALDATHAHLNMPAVIMWARGLELRPIRVTFERPTHGTSWQVATQLYPTADPQAFTAPNLQYLMESPAEFGQIVWRSFEAPVPAGVAARAPTIRVALHHQGSEADADAFAAGLRKIVEQARRVFGEFPEYERNTYTFLADVLPSAANDGMEHRNSCVLTSNAALGTARTRLLDTAAHEFFHGWNVERIRPRSLEPFDFEHANVSAELWLAEGVTSYYDGLLMTRAGFWTLDELTADLGAAVSTVVTSPAIRIRSAEDMSRLAPFVDAASGTTAAATGATYVSYYTFGAALGFGLDLAIRQRTAGAASLDDVMRALWAECGRQGGAQPGYVDRPYTVADVRHALAVVTGDREFADTLVDRYVEGHYVMDYERLLANAGLVLRARKGAPGMSNGRELEVVTTEVAGGRLSEAQRAFRARWLN
jgi:predicted metalloprotease with PDZ domain